MAPHIKVGHIVAPITGRPTQQVIPNDPGKKNRKLPLSPMIRSFPTQMVSLLRGSSFLPSFSALWCSTLGSRIHTNVGRGMLLIMGKGVYFSFLGFLYKRVHLKQTCWRPEQNFLGGCYRATLECQETESYEKEVYLAILFVVGPLCSALSELRYPFRFLIQPPLFHNTHAWRLLQIPFTHPLKTLYSRLKMPSSILPPSITDTLPLPLPILAPSLLLLLLYISSLIYTALLPGLRSLPGPLSARFTRWYRFGLVVGGQAPAQYRKLHARYGPIVRVGPTHVSVADPAAIPVIYGIGSGAKFLKVSVCLSVSFFLF